MHRHRIGALICATMAAHWAAVLLFAQLPTRTPVRDTLFSAAGSPVAGELLIEWQSFTDPDGRAIPRNSLSVEIVDGVVSLDLSPNEGSTPSGTSYRVRYTLESGERFTETWIVPDSATPVTVAQVRVAMAPPTTPTIGQAQVDGLAGALATKADVDQPNTFTAAQTIREDAPGSPNPLLGLEKDDGSAGVYFKLPPLSSSYTLALPNGPGLANQFLTSDGGGNLFWSSGSAGAGESAYEVLQQAGSNLTQRTIANFAEGFALVDSAASLSTEIRPLFGSSAGTVTEGDDPRLSDARQPLAHAASHAAAGADAVTPVSIGALGRNNDFMLSTSQTTPILKLQGMPGQSAALQEWRDGSGALAALVGPAGDAFFREMGVAAKIGGTVASAFFQLDGLTRFALSSTSSRFRILRYDDAGLFKDEAFRWNRSGPIESFVRMEINDASIGSGRMTLTGDYVELASTAAATTPPADTARVFLDSSSGEVSVRKSSGATVSLEQGGGGVSVHDQLGGLGDDDHPQYALLAGRAAGQTLTGGSGAGDDLTFETTSHAFKGSYIFSDLDCSANANGGALTANASGVISCSDDDGGAGGGASSISGLSDCAVSRNATTDLLDVETPCAVRFGNTVFTLTADAQLDLAASQTGTALIYVAADGTLAAGLGAMTVDSCSNITCGAASGFPATSLPLATWSASGGVWAASGTDHRGWGRDVVQGGTGIQIADASGVRTLSVGANVVRNDQNNDFGAFYQDFAEIAAPANPAADDARLYAKDDGGTTKLCVRDANGTEVCMGDSGGAPAEPFDPFDRDTAWAIEEFRDNGGFVCYPIGAVGLSTTNLGPPEVDHPYNYRCRAGAPDDGEGFSFHNTGTSGQELANGWWDLTATAVLEKFQLIASNPFTQNNIGYYFGLLDRSNRTTFRGDNRIGFKRTGSETTWTFEVCTTSCTTVDTAVAFNGGYFIAEIEQVDADSWSWFLKPEDGTAQSGVLDAPGTTAATTVDMVFTVQALNNTGAAQTIDWLLDRFVWRFDVAR